MVITGLIVTGFVVLLIAPTIHRSINEKSRDTAEAQRVARAQQLQNSADGASRPFDVAADAVRTRDRLLLRGVRSEVVSENGRTQLIYSASDSPIVEAVLDELDLS